MSFSKLNYDEFLRIVHQNKNNKHIFLLGAGASVTSGVQSAKDCIWDWKKAIYISNNLYNLDSNEDLSSDEIKGKIQCWIDKQGSFPPQNDPNEYSFFAEKAYPTESSRRKYFENIFEGTNPSYGYKILCLLVKQGFLEIVFTTNFDGLLTKAAHKYDLTPIEVNIDN